MIDSVNIISLLSKLMFVDCVHEYITLYMKEQYFGAILDVFMISLIEKAEQVLDCLYKYVTHPSAL